MSEVCALAIGLIWGTLLMGLTFWLASVTYPMPPKEDEE